MRLADLFSELRRRKVLRVAGAYAVVAFVVLQGADILAPALRLPGWTMSLIVFLLVLGFPVAVVLAWALDVTPEGVRRMESAASARASLPPTGDDSRHRAVAYAGIGILVALVGFGAYAYLGSPIDSGSAAEAPLNRSIAVLPFDNISPDPANEFFADGVHDEILTHLSRIGALKVISRTSVLGYRDTRKNLREIAGELGVRYILEGSVRRAGNRARITAQLIDARADAHLWAETYDSELMDIFAIQTSVAGNIAEALQAELSVDERARIAMRPTASAEAYDYYLRGNEYRRRSHGQENMEIALGMYEKAVEMDPRFALAYVELSDVHCDMYSFHYDRTEARLAAARRAVDRALEIAPDLAEVRAALGEFYYRCLLDYDRALEQLEIARSGLPGDAGIISTIGYVLRRQGRFEVGREHISRAVELDPRSNTLLVNLAETYMLLRDYSESLRVHDRAIALAPDEADPRISKAKVLLQGLGRADEARQILARIPRDRAAGELPLTYYAALVELFDRDYERALELVSVATDESFDTQFYVVPRAQLLAQIYALMGRSDLARAHYDSARAVVERRLGGDPEDSRLHSALGIALAGLDRKEEAIRAGERATELLPLEREAWRGAVRLEDLARIVAMVGEREAAIDLLQHLLSAPSEVSEANLRLDPDWDPLRQHPRFQRLVSAAAR